MRRETAGWIKPDQAESSLIQLAQNLKLGARVTSGGNSFYVGYGFALTDSVWYDKIFRIEYRATFGR